MMAKLYFSIDGNSLGEFSLSKERMTIGRRSANDIHIDNLGVSGEHAVITTIGNDSFLEDMNSTNGTLVNSKSIKKHVLYHNDVIEFGKYQLLYINESQTKAPVNTSGFENTVVMRPAKLVVASGEANSEVREVSVESAPIVADIAATEDIQEKPDELTAAPRHDASLYDASQSDAPQTDTSLAEKPVSEQASAPKSAPENATKIGRLQMLSGTNAGRELILNKALTTLGKPGMQVAVITKRPLGYFITHVEGENLPLVNGQKIGLQAHALANHDVIDLSGIKMEFFLV